MLPYKIPTSCSHLSLTSVDGEILLRAVLAMRYQVTVDSGGPWMAGPQPARGDPPNSTVVIRFADVEATWGFLNDPDYQLVKAIRLSATSRGLGVAAPGFTPAGG